MKVAVLTTSYPRTDDDVAGSFVRDAVDHLREAGIDVVIVSPASFRHFGIAHGHGGLFGAPPVRRRFLTSGDPATFRALGSRFIGPEVDAVEAWRWT